MKNFFIIHGSDGHSKENWFPWLKKELEKYGYECIAHDFPCEDGHQLSKWYKTLEKYKDKISKDTVFIAHSRGVSFVMNLLTDYDLKINSLFMVGGFINYLWFNKSKHSDTFFAKPFNFERVKKSCKNFYNYQSDNDPYIPIKEGEKINTALNSKYVLVKNAGHFNSEAGYHKFPLILEDLLKSLK